MSNEYKDWLEDLKNSNDPEEHKRWLLIEYPWLKMGFGEAINYLDVDITDVFTYIDCAPPGWAKLCEDLCAEIKPLLEKANFVDKYSLYQVKEKFGGLRWYDDGVPSEIYDEYMDIIEKYEKLSEETCVICGAPATKVSKGWICPFCDKCAEEINGTFEEIKE